MYKSALPLLCYTAARQAVGPNESAFELIGRALAEGDAAFVVLAKQMDSGKKTLQNSGARPSFEHAPIGYMRTNSSGIILNLNQCAVSQIGARHSDEITGRSLADVFTEGSEALCAAVNADEGQTGVVFKSRVSLKSSFDAVLVSGVVVARIPSTGDTGPEFEIYLEDALENEDIYKKMLQAEKLSALGEIVQGVAHELNNPLTGILGYAQLMLASASTEQMRSRLEQISSEAQRCHRIVEGLMNFSVAGESEKRLADINEVVENTMTLREYQMRVDGIAVTIEAAKDLPPVMIDVRGIQRAFISIINNAHHALLGIKDRNRRFSVSTGIDGSCVFIAFEDNGPGISQSNLKKIFDPFFSTREIGEGTGLGLSLSYGVITEHRGRIEADSVEGKGARFRVFLPCGTGSH